MSEVFNLVGELSRNSRIPTDQLSTHLTKLTNSVGKTSGTIQDVPSKHLQELAARSQNPSDFVQKYREAAAANTSNLAPMMEILHSITTDPEAKRHFGGQGKEHLHKNDYHSLKERLLQQVGSKAVLTESNGVGVGNGTSSDNRHKWMPFPERKLMTNDFVIPGGSHESDAPSAPLNTPVYGSLGCVPVPSQENALVQDLLFCFIGVPGVHLKPTIQNYKLSTGKLSFELSPDVDPTLRSLVLRITPLCQHYSVVVQFVEKYSQMSAGRVNQALSGAIRQVLKDYFVFVAELEAQHKRGELTLNKIWFTVQTKLETMSLIAELCINIDKASSRGGKTLSLLHEMTVEKSASHSDKVRSVGLFLTSKAGEPWFKILTRWIHKGMIDDPGKDFFVEDNEVIERSALPLEYSDDYWERRYSIKPDQIPAFLHAHADKILRTGKYLNVIQQCNGDAKPKYTAGGTSTATNRAVLQQPENSHEYSAMDTSVTQAISDDFEGRIIRRRAEMLARSRRTAETASELRYTEHPEEYAGQLEKAYATASKNLLQLLIADNDLIGHLKSVKHYFLLDQGDFVVQFFDVCGDELTQAVDNVEPTRLESLLELAIRTSVVNSDPYKDNVRVELLPYDLIYQMNKILSIDTEAEGEFKGPVDTENLSGLEAFAFGYDVQWPISLVLNRKSLACYQMLLRHLFFCKHVEKLISQVWLTTKVTRNFNYIESFHIYGPSFALRQKMLNFIQNLEYYMTFEVLEPNWEEMISKIKSGKVANVDQVLQIHSDFLTTCLNDCLLSSPILLSTVKKLLGVCCEFSAFMDKLINRSGGNQGSSGNDFSEADEDADSTNQEEDFVQEVAKFDLRFTAVLVSLLDKISQHSSENQKILNILHRLDFNGFYSKALDTFRCENSATKL